MPTKDYAVATIYKAKTAEPVEEYALLIVNFLVSDSFIAPYVDISVEDTIILTWVVKKDIIQIIIEADRDSVTGRKVVYTEMLNGGKYVTSYTNEDTINSRLLALLTNIHQQHGWLRKV